MMFGYRDKGDGAIVMTNGDNGSQLANELLASIAVEYGWVDYLPQEKTVVEVDAATLQSYAGDYQFAGGPLVQIRVKDGKLAATAGNDSTVMLPEAPDTFFDSEGGFPQMKFTKMSDGAIALSAGGGTAKKK